MTERPDDNLREAERWLKQATEAFAAAAWAAQGEHWANACFQFQQAAELALKALLIRQGENRRLHGLLHLLELLQAGHPDADRLAAAARGLDRFYIPTRYPDALPVGTSAEYFSEQHAVEARAAADEVLSFVRLKLTDS